jgi:hypothetical protein
MKAIHIAAVPKIFTTLYLIEFKDYYKTTLVNSQIYGALYLQYLFKYFRHIRSYEHFLNKFESSFLHRISIIFSYF